MARRQTTATLQTLFGRRLRLERRNGGATIYARTFLQGGGRVRSTGERTLSAATPIATDWYLGLLARAQHGENLHGRSFADLAEVFCLHAEQVTDRPWISSCYVIVQKIVDQPVFVFAEGIAWIRLPALRKANEPTVHHASIMGPCALSDPHSWRSQRAGPTLTIDRFFPGTC